MEQRVWGAVATRRSERSWDGLRARYETEDKLVAWETDAVRVRAVVRGRPVLMFGTVLRVLAFVVFVSMLARRARTLRMV